MNLSLSFLQPDKALKKENESLTNDVKSMKRNYDSLEQSYSGLLKKIRK